MTTIDLSPKENAALLDQVLSRAESRDLEFKRVSGKMVNKALETSDQIANHHARFANQ